MHPSSSEQRKLDPVKVIVARDTPCIPPETCTPAKKESGSARFVFISRISPKKNLLYALALMNEQPGASLEIYGPVEDAAYWAECQRTILRYKIPAVYRGLLNWDRVIPTFQRGHFFLFPTLSENFGHVIFEALAAGCPPLISNQTPWADLMEKECGWTMPLQWPEMWRTVISRCIAMPQDEYSEAAINAHRYTQEWTSKNIVEEYRRLFTASCTE